MLRLRQFVSRRFSSTWVDKFDEYLMGAEPVKDQHSKLLAKSNIIYNVEVEHVKPGHMSEYISNSAAVLPGIHSAKEIPTELYGQFTVEYGDLDCVYTIWRHTGGYSDIDTASTILGCNSEYLDFKQAQAKLLTKRRQQICYEFSFWPSYQDTWDGGIFEIRTYTLKAGCLYEWANAWSHGIKSREKDAVMGLCSQIGDMYTVHHIWRYTNLEARKKERDLAWKSGVWGDCVVRTVPLIRSLNVNILKPTNCSPLR